jgi:hypothetical protein
MAAAAVVAECSAPLLGAVARRRCVEGLQHAAAAALAAAAASDASDAADAPAAADAVAPAAAPAAADATAAVAPAADARDTPAAAAAACCPCPLHAAAACRGSIDSRRGTTATAMLATPFRACAVAGWGRLVERAGCWWSRRSALEAR